jgi:hypothetical protein
MLNGQYDNIQTKITGLADDITGKIRGKYQLYHDLKSKEMEARLQKIDDLKTRIDTKTASIKIANYESRQKDLYISLAWYFIFVIVFLVFPWIFYMGGWISYRPFIYIVFITLVLYSGFFAWKLNEFYFRRVAAIPTTGEVKKLYDYVGDQVYKEARRLERDYDKFMYQNCDCSHKHKKKHDNNATPITPTVPSSPLGYQNPDMQGYYYSDYGMPNEKIIPVIDSAAARKDMDPTKYFRLHSEDGSPVMTDAECQFCRSLKPAELCLDRNSICCPLPKAYAGKSKFSPEACTTGQYNDSYDLSAKYNPHSGVNRGTNWTQGL